MNTYDLILQILHQADHLPSRVLDNGTQLIGNIPYKAPKAYFHELFPVIPLETISSIEKEVEQKLPSSYTQFLTNVSNGTRIFANSLAIYGYRQNYEREGDAVYQPYNIITLNTHDRPKDAEPNTFFVGQYTDDGSKLFIDQNGLVHHCPRYTVSPILNTWPDFETMLFSETMRLSKLFDDQGRPIDPKQPTTPDPD